MKKFFNLFILLIFISGLAFAQDKPTLSVADDSKETLLEQAMSLAAEQSPRINNVPPFTGLIAQVTHPLFIGVDDVTVPAYVGNPGTNEWLQAFVGYQVWGAAYDNVNDKIYFNNGSTLYEWAVSTGIVTQLGTITDPGGATQSMVSLAFYNGALYSTKNIANEAVYEINTTTLVATVVIEYADDDFDFGGLAVDPNTGEFYGTSDDTAPLGSGLYRINMDGTGTLIAAYPSGQTDIDGLAISDNGIAYLVIDEPGNIFVYDLIGGTYLAPLTNPWTTAEIFSGGAWIYEAGNGGLLLINDNNTDGADSVETWLNILGVTYTRMNSSEIIALPTSDWLMYDAVIWVGSPSSIVEQDSSTAYLDAGGNLVAWDNDVGYYTNSTSYFLDYLMAAYQTDAGSDGTITGLDMMTGLTQDISADPYPDDVLPNTGLYGTGVPTFLAPTTTTYAGMRGDGGTFRTALHCWDPEYGADYATNINILNRVIDWLVYGIVPVELTSFTASVNETDVTLNWVTATEINNQGFEIERASESEFEKVGYIPGFGTTTEQHSYSFTDADLASGTYTYRLKQIDFDGSFSYSETVEVEVVIPNIYSLLQNYPNPFNPSTKITFSLAADSKVSLKIFDVLGQEVTSLINQDLSAGIHNYTFNATSINSGVYFYRIEATGVNGTEFVDVKKMILVK